MGKVLNPARPGDAEVEAQLVLLNTSFPEWKFRYEGASDLSWEAHRRPYQYPRSGCISWVRAATEERLRVLLTGVVALEADRGPEAAAHGKWCVR